MLKYESRIELMYTSCPVIFSSRCGTKNLAEVPNSKPNSSLIVSSKNKVHEIFRKKASKGDNSVFVVIIVN